MKRLVVILIVSFVLVNLLAVFFPQTIGLETTPSWTSSGDDQASACFGHSVASAGDVNGDGYDDVIIGADEYNTANTSAGKAYLYLGSSSGLETSPSWTSSGDDQANAYFGNSVASAGDVNGDGYSDVIIGASAYDTANHDAGKAYLYLGSSSGLQASPSWNSSGDDDQVSARFGCSVASAGDVNDDGYDDVIIGAERYDTVTYSNAGKAYLYLGSSSGLEASPLWTSCGDNDQHNAYFGHSVASAGDVNNDSYDDVIIGAYEYKTANTWAGKAYLYLGNSSIGLEASASWTSSGDDQTGARFGCSVASAGDVNDDGYSDVIIGAYYYNTGTHNAGRAYLYLGSSSGLEASASWTSSGDDQGHAHFGWSVASAGDVNGDSYSDVIIGAYLYKTNSGKAYLYLSNSSGLEASASWTSSGDDQDNARFGCSVASAGDVNNDSYDDVIIGAYWCDTTTKLDAGKAYLYLGVDTTPPATPTGLAVTDVPNDEGGALNITWDANTEPDLDHYTLYSNKTGSWAVVAEIPAGTEYYVDTGLTDGTRYYYNISASDDASTPNESPQSATANGVPADNLPPAIPSGLAVTDVSSDEGEALNITWDLNTDDTVVYSLYSNKSGSWQFLVNVTHPQNWYVDTGLTNGVIYYYRISAWDEVPLESDLSAPASGMPLDNLAPVAPTGLTVSQVANGDLNITWSANTELDLDHYTLYSNKTGLWAFLIEIPAGIEYYVDTGLTHGATYYYNISASDEVPNESPQSASASNASSDILPPATPTGLTVTDVPNDDGGALNITWNANTEPDLDHYTLYSNKTGSWAVVAEISAGTEYYIDTGLADGIRYYYNISASDDASTESPQSATANGVPADNSPPAAPTGLTAADHPNDEGGAIDLNWNDNTETDLDHYDVYRSTTMGGTYTWLAETTVSEYTDSTTTDGITYYYVVTASDAVPNESGYSNEASATSSDNLAPTAPTGLTASDHPNDEGGAIDLNWNDNTETDLDHYDVYRSTTMGGTYTWLAETTVSEYTDSTTTDGITYHYVVTASDEVPNESGYSAEASASSIDNFLQGTISGTVEDEDGNPIEGATVTIYESGTTTNPVASTTTNSNGEYSVNVPPGTYDVKIEMSGYDVQWELDVVVTVDQTTTTDLILPLILIPTTDILGDYWWLILLVIIVIIIIVALMVKKKKPVEVEEEEKPVEATEEEE